MHSRQRQSHLLLSPTLAQPQGLLYAGRMYSQYGLRSSLQAIGRLSSNGFVRQTRALHVGV